MGQAVIIGFRRAGHSRTGRPPGPSVDMGLAEVPQGVARPDGAEVAVGRADLADIRVADDAARHDAQVGGDIGALERPGAQVLRLVRVVFSGDVPERDLDAQPLAPVQQGQRFGPGEFPLDGDGIVGGAPAVQAEIDEVEEKAMLRKPISWARSTSSGS